MMRAPIRPIDGWSALLIVLGALLALLVGLVVWRLFR